MRTLLSAGADPGIQNASGENALDTASTSHMKQIYVDELLRATGNSEYAHAPDHLLVFLLILVKIVGSVGFAS